MMRLRAFRRIVPATLLSLTLVSLQACSGILGLKDLEPYPAEGGTDSGERDQSVGDGSGSDVATDGPAEDAHDATSDTMAANDGPGVDGSMTNDSAGMDGPEGMDGSSGKDSAEDTSSTTMDTGTTTGMDSSTGVDSSTGMDASCTTGSQTDPHNCGTCGHDCLAGTCKAGRCQPFTLATSVTAWDLAVQNGQLFWTDEISPGGAVWTCTVASDACPVRSFATGQNSPERLTINGGTVYWTNYGTGAAADGSVASEPVGGGTISTLAASVWTPTGIAVDATYAFWAESYNPTPQLVRYDLSTKATTPFTTGAGSKPTGVALLSGALYWTDAVSGTGSVQKSAEAMDSPSPIGSSQDTPWAVSANAVYVYWVDYSTTGAVWQYTIGTAGRQQVGTSDSNPIRIVSDPSYAFWVDEGTAGSFNGKLVEWDDANQVAIDRATGLDQPTAVAMDANAVYFATVGDGLLHMMVR
jgi:hypothetical protein